MYIRYMGHNKGNKMKQLIRTLATTETINPKAFRVIKITEGYLIASVSNGHAVCEKYPTYPANVINVLKNIGYIQSN